MRSLPDEYQIARPQYEALASQLVPTLEILLDHADIKYHVVEGRVKSVESLLEKVQREGKNYQDPLREVIDLCGVRIIVFYAKDVARVWRLLESEFRLHPEHSTR